MRKILLPIAFICGQTFAGTPASVAENPPTCLLAATAQQEINIGYTLDKKAHRGNIHDGVSTGLGIALGGAEGNLLGPVMPLLLTEGVIDSNRTLPIDERARRDAALAATKEATTAHNLCAGVAILTGGTFFLACPFIGLLVGKEVWDEVSEEREFWTLCQWNREEDRNPYLVCTYRPTHSAEK